MQLREMFLALGMAMTVAVPLGSQAVSPERREDAKLQGQRRESAEVPPASASRGSPRKQGNDPYNNSLWRPAMKNLVEDQKAIWTSPARLTVRDATWLVPLGGLAAGLVATDRAASGHLSSSPGTLRRYRQLSNYGTFSLVGAAGGLYLWGNLTGNEHRRETGFLAGEALVNAVGVNSLAKLAFGRERPRVDNGRGRFLEGGQSFPSDHAAAAWALASVIAHEYPGPLTKLLAYGLASGVSASRVRAREHFPSDVLVGSALGWLIGREVYLKHHDPELGGGTWDLPRISSPEGRWQSKNMGSPYVPLDSWIYPAVTRLAALGYVDTAFLGMRPWTRLECARLVSEAGDRLGEEESDPAEPTRLYDALEQEFSGELQLLGGGTNRRLRVESIYTRVTAIAGKPVRDGYHFGQTIINDFGRPYAEGFNNVTGFSGWASDGPFVAYLRGEYQHAPSAPALPAAARSSISQNDGLPPMPALATPAVNRFDVVEGYVGMAFGNWQITAGKQSLWWGPGKGGSMIYSDNAEPMDMLRITRVSPFKLPSILGLMGPIRVEFFVGQQHGAQFLDTPQGLVGQWGKTLSTQPIIHGQKISFKPTANLEIGFSRTTVYGGPGFPLTGHTFFRSLFSTTNEVAGAPNKPGDRRAGFDMTYRLPGLRNRVTFYADSFADDEFTPVAYFDRAANSAGLYFPRLPKLHQWDLRIEGVYSDNPLGGNLGHGFYYSNGTWRYGYRNAGNLIGSWIGRDGQGAQAWLTYWLRPDSTIQLRYRHQKVSQQFIPGGGTVNDGGVNANFWLRRDLSASVGLEYERWKFPVRASQAENNVTTTFQLTFWPRWQVR